MNTLSMLLWLVSSICTFVFAIQIVVSKVRKKEIGRKKTYIVSSFAVSVVTLIIFAATLPPSNNTGQTALPESEISETESSSESEPDSEPESSSEPETVELDFERLTDDLKEELTNPEFFGYVRDIYVGLDSSGNTLNISAILDDATDPMVALDFADTALRRCNLLAQMQDSTIESSGNEYYGGLYDRYSVLIGVAPNSSVDDTKGWFVYEAITGGRYKELELNKDYTPVTSTAAPQTSQNNSSGNADNFNTYSDTVAPEGANFVGNSNTMLFHYPTCDHVSRIAPEHVVSIDSVDSATSSGYSPCGVCNPGGASTQSSAQSQSSSAAESSSSSTPESSQSTERVVYWGDTGTKIHTNRNCRTLKGNVHSGTEAEAIAAGRTEGYCKVC